MKGQRNIETYPYVISKKYNTFEIRNYEETLFTSVKLSTKGYKNSSSKGFSILAGYIFGNNERNEKISMTSPVLYNINNSPTFSFIMPSEFDQKNLPIPKNTEIFFKTEYNQCVATIKFGGFANDEKCQKIYDELKELLDLNNISFNENYIIAIYNSPYQLLNRKNEIWIEVNKDQVQKKLDI